jgi:hypothetical protein
MQAPLKQKLQTKHVSSSVLHNEKLFQKGNVISIL